MLKPNTPCKDCPNRTFDCHTKCEEYLEYAEFCRWSRDRKFKMKNMDNDVRKAIQKMKRSKRR